MLRTTTVHRLISPPEAGSAPLDVWLEEAWFACAAAAPSTQALEIIAAGLPGRPGTALALSIHEKHPSIHKVIGVAVGSPTMVYLGLPWDSARLTGGQAGLLCSNTRQEGL